MTPSAAALAPWFPALVTVAVFLALVAWEHRRPNRAPGRETLARGASNLLIFGLNGAAVGPVAAAGSAAVLAALASSSAAPATGFGAAATLVYGVLVVDLIAYLLHRLHHAVPVLWRFHAVHHSDPIVDLTTAVRHHPAEYALTGVAAALLAAGAGVPAPALALYGTIALITQFFHHANIALPARIERLGRLIIVTPGLHRVHHSINTADNNTNFAAVFPIWDRIFRTYRAAPDGMANRSEFGLMDLDPTRCRGIIDMLLVPLRIGQPAYARPQCGTTATAP
jgi:sterol desaturase/sphingolipid hydroxylase (fatty acid hydroxylase superfamily)